MTAVILGGLGFPVLVELARFRRPGAWSLHTQLVIATSAVLLVGGALVLGALEWGNEATIGAMALPTKLLAVAFMSVAPRSIGFATIDYAGMGEAGRIVTDALMFVGAGSAGTSGGIKVGTLAVLALAVYAEARGDVDVHAFGRRIATATVRQALAVLGFSIVLSGFAIVVMLQLTDFELSDAIFEAVSATAVVGLSTGVTDDLPLPGAVVRRRLHVRRAHRAGGGGGRGGHQAAAAALPPARGPPAHRLRGPAPGDGRRGPRSGGDGAARRRPGKPGRPLLAPACSQVADAGALHRPRGDPGVVSGVLARFVRMSGRRLHRGRHLDGPHRVRGEAAGLVAVAELALRRRAEGARRGLSEDEVRRVHRGRGRRPAADVAPRRARPAGAGPRPASSTAPRRWPRSPAATSAWSAPAASARRSPSSTTRSPRRGGRGPASGARADTRAADRPPHPARPARGRRRRPPPHRGGRARAPVLRARPATTAPRCCRCSGARSSSSPRTSASTRSRGPSCGTTPVAWRRATAVAGARRSPTRRRTRLPPVARVGRTCARPDPGRRPPGACCVGDPDTLSGAVGVSVTLDVVAPAGTLLGGDAPGELVGYGPVAAEVVRELAEDAAWRRWVTDADGTVLQRVSRRYRPGRAMVDLLRARDGTCRFPTCRRRAKACDIDHVVPWPAGPTVDGQPRRPLPAPPPAQAPGRLARAPGHRRHAALAHARPAREHVSRPRRLDDVLSRPTPPLVRPPAPAVARSGARPAALLTRPAERRAPGAAAASSGP